jgi:hypothetical protein
LSHDLALMASPGSADPVPGNLGSAEYCRILSKARPDFSTIFGAGRTDWTFLHDGASPHKALATNAWLRLNVPHHFTSGPNGEWPANSPDLNIIEQIWGQIKLKLASKPPKTMEALKARVKAYWAEQDMDSVAAQVAGMKKRLKSIIASGGEWTAN